jgi:hypothetical protein
MKFKSTLLAAFLGALVMFGSAGIAQASGADRYDACARRIFNEQRALDRAIEHHGLYSRQAEHARLDLEKARAACGAPEYR